MNFTIDREKFKQLLSQFRGDIPYQTDLVNTLFNQMPDNYVDDIIKTMYYERIFIGTYYVVQHSVYTSEKYIFEDYAGVLGFLNSIKLEDKLITKFTLTNAIERKTSLCGYNIIKIIRKENNNE
jgi:hypothetical protein